MMISTINSRQAIRSFAVVRNGVYSGVRSLAMLVAGGVLCVAANAADGRSKSTADADYQRERAACMSGATQQDRTTCLKEAGAARGEARRGNLSDDARAQQNAVARCNALPEADRIDCVRRIQGDGTVSGSVGGGGVLRETVTTVPSPPQSFPAPPQPMPDPAAPVMIPR